MEKARFPNLGLLGRHTFGGSFSPSSAEKFGFHAQIFGTSWHGNQLQKIPPGTLSDSAAFGLHSRFKAGLLQVPQEKLKTIQKELGKILTHSEMTTRKMAAILGATRSFLMAMPFLRAFTDQLVQFVNQQEIHGWDQKLKIPLELKEQVREMGSLILEWKGRNFHGKATVRELHSDSSQEAWSGVDKTSGQLVQEFWTEKRHLHM